MSLFDAVKAGEVARVEELLASGEDPNVFGERGRTPLMVAAEAGHEAVVRVLLDNGAEPSFTDALGESALVMAAANGHADLCKLLMPHAREDEQDLARQLLAGFGNLTELPRGPVEPAAPPTRKEGFFRKMASAGAYVAGKLGDDGPTQRLERALRSSGKDRQKP